MQMKTRWDCFLWFHETEVERTWSKVHSIYVRSNSDFPGVFINLFKNDFSDAIVPINNFLKKKKIGNGKCKNFNSNLVQRYLYKPHGHIPIPPALHFIVFYLQFHWGSTNNKPSLVHSHSHQKPENSITPS